MPLKYNNPSLFSEPDTRYYMMYMFSFNSDRSPDCFKNNSSLFFLSIWDGRQREIKVVYVWNPKHVVIVQANLDLLFQNNSKLITPKNSTNTPERLNACSKL